MGMFDSVIVNCPNCGNEIEFQSKAGECRLKEYKISSVPITIAESIKDTIESCRNCGTDITLKSNHATNTSMFICIVG